MKRLYTTAVCNLFFCKEVKMEILCKMREIYRAIADVEEQIEKTYGISLNEGMLLCCLRKNTSMCASDIAQQLGLTMSNTSKVIKSVEDKEFVIRDLNKDDKRKMFFTLTDKGRKKVESISIDNIEIPKELSTVFNK